jgi:orotidine-5'-phosphate decarboxylase
VDQLLIALDVDRADDALRLAGRLKGAAGGFKIGSRLFTAEGPAIVRALVERNERVFLDLKFHDIPSTVAGAVAAATRLGVWMVNVHASGGRAMLEAARRAADETAAAEGRPAPLVIAVTVLTSLENRALRDLGTGRPVAEQVLALASMARDARLDGVVASPQEIRLIRDSFGPAFTVVTPGIRSGEAAGDGTKPSTEDQVRTMTAAEAVRAGASFIVVGRPVLAAPDPVAAARRLAEEIRKVR